MNMVETIMMFLDDNRVDVDLILSEETSMELIEALIENECQFAQNVKRIRNVLNEIAKAEDGVVSISRLITADGDSIYFVFPVDEHKIENEHVVIEKHIVDYLNIDALDHITNKYIICDEEEENTVEDFIKDLLFN